ncbi:MAG: YncE family protein, partial [Candidatus Binatia bacterium]
MRGRIPDENHVRRVAAFRLALRIALFPGPALLAGAQTIGMVADDATDSVVVFDADSETVLGAVPVGTGVVGDCSVTDDQTLGFVTDFAFRVWVIDLASTPPVLAQPDPIRISNPGEDTALSPDGRFLVVCDGFGSDPVSVVDVASRTEVSTFSLGSNCSSVDVCNDGSVLVASSNAGRVHRLVLNDSGVLSHTGETLSTGWLA